MNSTNKVPPIPIVFNPFKMLTTGESKLIFAYIYVGSYINVIPYNLDHRTGKLSKLPLWKNIIWWVLFSLMLLQTGLNDLQWIYDRIARSDVPITLVSMQLNFALNPLVYLTTIQWALIRERDLLMYVFNQVYTKEFMTSRKRPLRTYTKLDILSLYYTFLGSIQAFYLIPGVLYAVPQVSLMATSLLKWNLFEFNSYGHLAFVIYEAWLICFWLINYVFLLMVHSLVVSRMELWVDKTEEILHKEDVPLLSRIHLAYEDCRQLQLYTIQFNRINSTTLYVFKMMMMYLAINNGYNLVRHYQENLSMTLFSATLVFPVAFTVYSLKFGATYKTQARVEELYERLRYFIGLSKIGSQDKVLVAKQMRSVPVVAIKVGAFYTIERDATMQFIDFVTNQLVGLLVTFQ